jgi:ATP-dependent RNA helicase RhlE
VVNYELPQVAEDYIHRIGRTGRAGSEGEALSLVCVDEQSLLRDIEKLLRKDLPKDVVSGYAPDPSIPAEPIQTGRQGSGGRGRGPARAPRAASGTAPRGERGRHPSRPGARGK